MTHADKCERLARMMGWITDTVPHEGTIWFTSEAERNACFKSEAPIDYRGRHSPPDPYNNDSDFGALFRWWLSTNRGKNSHVTIKLRGYRGWFVTIDSVHIKGDDMMAAVCDAILELEGNDE